MATAAQPDRRTAAVSLGVAAIAVGAVGIGASVATGGIWPFACVGLAALSIVLIPAAFPNTAFGSLYLAVEAPMILLLLSTFTFRVRDASALATNPLDSAAIYRVACIGLAGLLGWAALLRPGSSDPSHVRLPWPVRPFLLYIPVVFLGALISVDAPLTAYRGVELAAGLLVVVGAVRAGGAGAIERLEQLLYRFVVILTFAIWLNVLLFPGEAITRQEPLPYQIQSVYPGIASNGVGQTGALLILWSIGRLVSPPSRHVSRRFTLLMIAVGFVTLVGAQYRTGYVAVAAGLALLLIARGRIALALVAVVAVVGVVTWGASVAGRAEPVLLRGQTTERASELSGRISFWEKSIPVWRRSPILGRGLVTATRFEVLAPLGLTTISTIHSSWIEALVGTGVVGVGLIGLAVLTAWYQALGHLFRRDGLVTPAMLLVVMTVSSVTTSVFEIFGVTFLLFLVVAYRLAISPLPRGRLRSAT
jgi:O-antigen ligase